MSQSDAQKRALERAQRAAEIEAAMALRAREDWFSFMEFVLAPQDTSAGTVLSLRDDQKRILEGYARLREKMLQSKRLVVIAASRLGKSTLITYGDTLWDAGQDPENSRTLIGSATQGNAIKHGNYLRKQIEGNKRLRMVFPHLMPGNPWNEEKWSVSGSTQAQPTVQCIGDLAQFQGFRAVKHKYDDMVDPTIALSKLLCEKQAEWIMDINDRVESYGFRWFIQNAHRSHDTGHLLVQKFKWDLYVMPAIDEGGKTLYPKIWPQPVVDEYEPARKNQHLRAIPPQEGDRVYADEILELCQRTGVGLQLEPPIHQDMLPDGVFIVHGVDPAGVKSEEIRAGKDDWGMVSALAGPPDYFLENHRFAFDESRELLASLASYNETKPNQERLMVCQLLNVDGGQWGVVEGKRRIIEAVDRYGGAVVVENNGVQGWMKELLLVEAPHILVHAPHTGRNKMHSIFGVGAEVNAFTLGAWIIPSYLNAGGIVVSEGRAARLLEDLRGYSPTSHTPDRVSALWLARCGARFFAPLLHRVLSVDLRGMRKYDETSSVGSVDPTRGLLEAQMRAQGVRLPTPAAGSEATVAKIRRRFL